MAVRAGTWLLVLGAVLVAGCSGDERSGSLPVLPVTAGTQSAATANPVPTEALPKTPQAASAFAKYFLSQVDVAFRDGDPSPIKRLSAAGCGGCEALSAAVDALVSEGQRQVGGEYVDVVAVTPALTGGDVLVDVTYRRNAGRLLDSSGTVIASDPPVPMTSAQMRLLREGSRWVVQGYRILPT